MKLTKIFLSETFYGVDQIDAAAQELAKLAQEHSKVVTSTRAIIPSSIATQDMLLKYFEKTIKDHPTVEKFKIEINADGVPEASPMFPDPAPMTPDEKDAAIRKSMGYGEKGVYTGD